MKKSNIVIILFIFLTYLSSCSHSTKHKTDKEFNTRTISSIPGGDFKMGSTEIEDVVTDKENRINKKLQDFQEIIEKNLVWREIVMGYFPTIRSKEILSNEDLVNIHKYAYIYKNLRDELWQFVNEFMWITNKNVKIKLISTGKTIKVDEKKIFTKKEILRINPNDELGKIYIKNIKISLAAALILCDNYLVVIQDFERVEKLRRTVDNDNIEFSGLLREINKSFNKVDNFKRISKGILEVRKELDWEVSNQDYLDEGNKYLNALIKQSYFYHKNKDMNFWHTIFFAKAWSYGVYLHDKFNKFKEDSTNEVSKLFGNAIGVIQFGDGGKLKNISKEEEEGIKSVMKPLDIILEKTPFRLTDRFIPGHWGHVAIWVGTEEELIELGVWDELPEIEDEAITKWGYKGESFQELVRSGHHVLEALRPGVQINKLRDFLDIDDLAVVRPKELTSYEKKEYLIHAFEQIGKDYDFNFDVETDTKIVCSELAFVVFNDEEKYSWPTEKKLGRHTISPDNVASQALKGGDFYPVLLYHDGNRLGADADRPDKLDENFQYLFESKYDQIVFDEKI